MDSDTIWRNVAAQRTQLADLLDTLTPEQWATDSLCAGWTVREVAVHLTQSQLSRKDIAMALLKSGFRFNATVQRLALSDAAVPATITARLRAMADSRQRPPMTKEIDPLLDLLIHSQDICVPLDITYPMPTDAAAAVAHRLWDMKFPLNPRRDLPGYRFAATDAEFEVGPEWGTRQETTIDDIVMMLARRRTVPPSPQPDDKEPED